MPAVIKPQPDKVGVNADEAVSSSQALFDSTRRAIREIRRNAFNNGGIKSIVQHSFGDLDNAPDGNKKQVIPYSNGFVHGITRAFQQDLHLVLRPDDVWLAALAQFSFYVNGHAEELRKSFVNHDGREEIEIDMRPERVWTANIGVYTARTIEAMKEKLVDPGLTDWLVPQFSTTTQDDRTVAAFVVMSTMKSYFVYVLSGGCGFPSVTLMGEKED
jgi:hypothetical protein